MSRITSSIRSFERSGPSCSPIAVEPTTSAISAVTMRRSPLVTVAAMIEFYRCGLALPARVNRDREVEHDVVRRGQVGLETCQYVVRAGSGREQPLLHLFDGVEAYELVRKGLRKAPAAEVPAVELLQEAGRALLAHLRDGVADEMKKLGDDFLTRGLIVDNADDLSDRPRVSLRDAADHDRGAAGLVEHRLSALAARDVAGRDHRN